MITQEQIDAAVERGKREILRDIADGKVPTTVATFADLHDWRDANLYGGLTEAPFFDDDAEEEGIVDPDASMAVQFDLDRWLRDGRPTPPLATYEVVLRVRATETDEDRFVAKDVRDGIENRLDEFYPTWRGFPVVPEVAFAYVGGPSETDVEVSGNPGGSRLGPDDEWGGDVARLEVEACPHGGSIASLALWVEGGVEAFVELTPTDVDRVIAALVAIRATVGPEEVR